MLRRALHPAASFSSVSRLPFYSFSPLMRCFSSQHIRDPYKVLGVSRNASDSDIKKAYRSLARKLHPDINKAANASEKFQEVHDAYDMISSKEKRNSQQYQNNFNQQFYQQRGRPNSNQQHQQQQQNNEEFQKQMFEELFRQQFSRQNQRRSQGRNPRGSHQQEFEFFEFDSTHEHPFFSFGFDKGRPETGYTSRNLKEKFPREFRLVETIAFQGAQCQFSILYRKHIELGAVTRTDEGHYLWTNEGGQLIAEGYSSRKEESVWTTETVIITNTEKANVGTISVSYFTPFPILSFLSMYDRKNNAIGHATRFAFMGTRLQWNAGNSPLARAIRGPISVGRTFDMDIGTFHNEVNPAIYMFSVLQSHFLDVQVSPGRFLLRKLVGFFKDFISRRQ